MTEEEVSSTITVTTTNNNNKSPVDDNIVNQPLYIVKEKKKQSAFGFLKAASLKLRRRSSLDLKQQKFSLQQETVPPVDKKGENLKKLVGSMRPLHLQDNQSPPSPHELPPPMKSTSLPVDFSEHFSSPTSSVGTISQYASANNLQELYGDSNDNDNEKEDPDHVFDSIGADDMIDAKAENFIAQFYEQMRRQQ